MKRFKYSLENVLHYKEQILDSIKAEHGTLLAQIRKKEAEIQELENKLVSAQNKMDDLKKQDVQIKDICLYGMYISEMEDQIRKKQEQLKLLQQQEEKKKEREGGERRGYGFAGLVIVLAIVFAAAAWNNKINLSRLNDQLTGIKNEIQKELNTDTTMETIGNGVVTPPAVTTEVPTQSPAANVSPAGIQ